MRVKRANSRWLVLLAALHATVIFAGFFSPYDPAEQDRKSPYSPPMRLHFVDARGRFHARPFVYSLKLREETFDQYDEDKVRPLPLKFFVRGASQLSRFFYGGQVSLLAGLLGAGVTLLLGLCVGALAGYFGGWRDDLLMRLAELFLALPWLYLLFALRAFLPLAVSPLQAFFLIIAVLGAVGWARPARLVRGVVLSAKERDFVRAARGFGANDLYLLRRHILPEASSVLLTQAAILVPQFVLAEMTLSFFGLGVPEPVPSWGSLLSSLQQYSVLASHWWMYLPALIMLPFFLGYLGLGGELQQRREPYKIGEQPGGLR